MGFGLLEEEVVREGGVLKYTEEMENFTVGKEDKEVEEDDDHDDCGLISLSFDFGPHMVETAGPPHLTVTKSPRQTTTDTRDELFSTKIIIYIHIYHKIS